ncbi:AMP-binding protein [Paraburkholderia sp. J10-1]|uniref:AMP-binding protein n=1 Tax=Paraburkholderia sp. J10-1 TaxID=2805430 RepID=UPI002AB739EC|nr:AMP-binding protein [Paraburkholderia sp. J10-1]
MAAPADACSQALPYRSPRIPAWDVHTTYRADGTVILSSAQAPAIEQNGFVDFLPYWAQRRAHSPVFCERDAQGGWRSITWSGLWNQVRHVAAGLLNLGLGQERPLMLLSGNSIEQAILLLAAEYAGVPTAPVSPAYSTISSDFARLKGIAALVQPAAIFVQDRETFERAIAALGLPEVPVIAVHGSTDEACSFNALASLELTPARIAALASARAAIQPADVLRILFTSGSTGAPKGVVSTYANFKAATRYFVRIYGTLSEPQPVFLDWMPWHHTMGGVLAFGRTMVTGASHYIDDGRPVAGHFERTLRNLRDVSPTAFSSAPSALTMLANALEDDAQLAQKLFARLINFGYGGASLPRATWERIQRVAAETIGEHLTFCTSLGATETNGTGTWFAMPSDDLGNIGVPGPGVELKLAPLEGGDGRFEIRMRGAAIFGGYLKDPSQSAKAFDEEGYLCLGDAVRLVNAENPSEGLRFAGRVAEDFKLTNGTWVRTGSVRLGLLEQCAPLLTDAVICGHDRDYVAALAWPNVAACRRLAPELAALEVEALIAHPVVIAALNERLRMQKASGASLHVRRLMLMAEPPSIDANETTDKGYVNQAACRARRGDLIDEVYRPTPRAFVASTA